MHYNAQSGNEKKQKKVVNHAGQNLSSMLGWRKEGGLGWERTDSFFSVFNTLYTIPANGNISENIFRKGLAIDFDQS